MVAERSDHHCGDDLFFHSLTESPEFIKDDQQAAPFLTPLAGTTVKLGCRSTGSPRPEVTWSKDGVELLPIEGVMSADGRDVLLLPQVTLSDNGQYTCRVWNRAGMISRHYVINVDGK